MSRPLYSHHDMGKTLEFKAKNPNQGSHKVQIGISQLVYVSSKEQPIFARFFQRVAILSQLGNASRRGARDLRHTTSFSFPNEFSQLRN
jgi:N-formylglutamate amidohydrolase